MAGFAPAPTACFHDLHPCPVVRDASKQHGPAADLLRICKACLPHQTENSALRIIFQTIAGMKQARQEASRAVLRSFKIEHVKFAAAFENAPCLTQCLSPVVRGQVMEHETRKHAIEGSLLIRELVRKSRIELDADRCTNGLAFGSSESLGIGIESNHFDIRMKP